MLARRVVFAVLQVFATAVIGRPSIEKPNIVMLFGRCACMSAVFVHRHPNTSTCQHPYKSVDDLGYGDLGFTGHPTVKTPNIDALANGGKILNSWYSGCPVCSGSRAALMTGRQFNRVGVPGVFGDTSTTGLPLNETTVADQLKKAGYATAIMGKWSYINSSIYTRLCTQIFYKHHAQRTHAHAL